MKLFVESQETGSRWEMEIDADKQTVLDLLDSEEWIENVESEFLSEDWNRKGRGFEVFGLEDEDISTVVGEIKVFFEEQGFDVEDIEYNPENLYAEEVEVVDEFDEDLDEDYESDPFEEDEDYYDDASDDEDY